jgi:porin
MPASSERASYPWRPRPRSAGTRHEHRLELHHGCGLGWARTELSNDFASFLRQRLDLGLDKEDTVEIYYNASIARWLNATLDLQIINQALMKKLDSSGQLGTAVVAGFRLYARF